MEWIIDNWDLILLGLGFIAIGMQAFLFFVKEPNEQKIETVKEWLLYAVVEAEKIYGSQTGQLKLHYVYNLAIERFEWIPKFITFDMFSSWVDDALIWMRVQLTSNDAVKDYVGGSDNG